MLRGWPGCASPTVQQAVDEPPEDPDAPLCEWSAERVRRWVLTAGVPAYAADVMAAAAVDGEALSAVPSFAALCATCGAGGASMAGDAAAAAAVAAAAGVPTVPLLRLWLRLSERQHAVAAASAGGEEDGWARHKAGLRTLQATQASMQAVRIPHSLLATAAGPHAPTRSDPLQIVLTRACLHGRGACVDFTLKSAALIKTNPSRSVDRT